MGEAVFPGYLEDHAVFNDDLSGLKMHIPGSLPFFAESPVAPEGLWQGRVMQSSSPVPCCRDAERRVCAPGARGLCRSSPGTGAPLALSSADTQPGEAVLLPGAAAELMPSTSAMTVLWNLGIPGSPKGLYVPLRRSISPALSFPEHALGWAMRWDQHGAEPTLQLLLQLHLGQTPL